MYQNRSHIHNRSRIIDKKGFLLCFVSLLLLAGCTTLKEQLYYTAFTLLPGVTPEMNRPGFWISKVSDPDAIIMNDVEIQQFNNDAAIKAGMTPDLFTREDRTSDIDEISQNIKKINEYYQSLRLYDLAGKEADKQYYAEVTGESALENISGEVEYGFVCKTTSLRGLPSERVLNDIKGEFYFDAVQYCALYPGEPVKILHVSRSGQWCYAATRFVTGWLKSSDIVRCSFALMSSVVQERNVVVSSVKADIFADPEGRAFMTFTRMGTRYHAAEMTGRYLRISIPTKNERGEYAETSGYIDRNRITAGFLPYTKRNLIETAFQHLNAPYGWGGMFGEADCSMFLNEVFAVFGIWLPRNSANQSLVGTPLPAVRTTSDLVEKETYLVENGIPGMTLLRLPGHIVMYLGEHEKKAYVLHAVWAYKERGGSREYLRAINKVAVSDLHLGEESKKGSLLKRINRGVIIEWHALSDNALQTMIEE